MEWPHIFAKLCMWAKPGISKNMILTEHCCTVAMSPRGPRQPYHQNLMRRHRYSPTYGTMDTMARIKAKTPISVIVTPMSPKLLSGSCVTSSGILYIAKAIANALVN